MTKRLRRWCGNAPRNSRPRSPQNTAGKKVLRGMAGSFVMDAHEKKGHPQKAPPKKKGAGTRPALPPYNCCIATYPLVTTGGGALPLPTSAQPAMLRRANTAAVARASFFMKRTPPCHDTLNHTDGPRGPLVLKRHSLDQIASRSGFHAYFGARKGTRAPVENRD